MYGDYVLWTHVYNAVGGDVGDHYSTFVLLTFIKWI